MRTTKLFQMLIVAVIFAATAVSAYSTNLRDYNVRETYEYWEEIEDGTSFGNGSPWGEIVLPDGFAFNYDNMNVNRLYVYGDGYLRFNYEANPTVTPNFAQYSYMVSWYTGNLTTVGDLSYKIIGTAPFRTLIIQHLGAKTYLDNSKNYFEAQIRIYETTNEISVMYGESGGIGRKGIDGALFFSGSSSTSEYWVVEPKDPFAGSNSGYNGGQTYGLNSTTRNWIYEGRTWTLTPKPTVAKLYPDEETILVRGNIYSGEAGPYFEVNRSETQEEIEYRYYIEDEDGNVVYESDSDPADETNMEWITPDEQPVGNRQKIYIEHANAAWGVYSDGSLDIKTDEDNIEGGTYTVVVQLREKTSGSITTYRNDFTVALEDDLEVSDIIYPSESGTTVYPYNKTTPVEVKLRNLGNRSLTKFDVTATIEHVESRSTTVLKYTFDSSIPPTKPLKRGESLFIYSTDWDQLFVPSRTGEYKISVTTKLRDAAGDDQPENNIFPNDGTEYLFKVGYDYEGEIVDLAGVAKDAEYINYPIVLGAELQNNGSIDLAGNLLHAKIYDPSGNEVYSETLEVDNLPYLDYANNQDFYFEEVFFAEEEGSYRVELEYVVDGDVVSSNNTETFYIDVRPGLKGEYSISATNGDFATISEAVDALYRRGVAGDVTFYLQDLLYNEGSLTNEGPAIDLSGKIIGVSDSTTVTFTVEEDDFGTPIDVHLYSYSGVGILFGQNAEPVNKFAPVHYVTDDDVNEYSTSAGYITFDGLNTTNFILHTSSTTRSVVKLGNGAQNITFKNSKLLDNAKTYNCDIPGMRFNAGSDRFEFSESENLSTGVLLRNTTPYDEYYGRNAFKLDTIPIRNNVIKNNEITGFGLGIVSCGIAALIDDKSGELVPYYNENNNFCDNTIYDVAKAGIFIGFEEGSTVKGNTVFEVGGTCTDSPAGIIAGGETDEQANYYGYNNIDLTINANEVYNVYGAVGAYGIVVEQVKSKIAFTGREFIIPYDTEETKILNNSVWNLMPTEDEAEVVGISLMTERNDDITEAKMTNYFTSGDFIANNTILIEDNGTENTGNVIGLAIINSKDAVAYNNAIAISDVNTGNTEINAAVYYKSLLPRHGKGLVSDRNAFDLENVDTDIFRLTHINGDGVVINEGFNGEFVNLNQWFYWTEQDANSVVGEFSDLFAIFDTKRPEDEDDVLSVKSLRIKKDPYPKNCLLNNRGVNLPEEVASDIDGDVRGNAEERYDIGADEFGGTSWKYDLELIRITEPGVYKAEQGKFSDNEYIMTEAPVDITVKLRNNSSVSMSNPRVHVKIYHETYDGVMDPDKNKVMEYTAILPAIGAFQTRDLLITDKQNVFIPETYGDWRRNDGSQPFDVPERFQAMEPNVSPLYRIEITLDDDQSHTNNAVAKNVRFYLKRSTLDMLVSTKYLKYDLETINPMNTNYLASQLNLDTMKSVFHQMGYSTMLGPEPENNEIDVDIFDRTEWEPRSVDYPLYRTLLWGDGDDKDMAGNANTLTNYNVINLQDFFLAGNVRDENGNKEKKNFLAASQEFVRNNDLNPFAGEILHNVFRVKADTFLVATSQAHYRTDSPMGLDEFDEYVSYSGNTVSGREELTENVSFDILKTQYFGDEEPFPAITESVQDDNSVGQVYEAFRFDNHVLDNPKSQNFAPEKDRVAATVSTSTAYNIIVLNVDWRHWAEPHRIMKGCFDYFKGKGGLFDIPVELAEFDAALTSNAVEVTWTTASEVNTSHFEVEKAEVENGNTGIFETVGTRKAEGNSSSITYYGPVIDNKIESGSTYGYRLKSVDFDGSIDYSDIVIVETGSANSGIALNTVAPLPVADVSEMEYTIGKDSDVTVELIDMNGSVAAVLANGFMPAGSYTADINASKLASGSYIIVIKAGSEVVTKQINVVK